MKVYKIEENSIGLIAESLADKVQEHPCDLLEWEELVEYFKRELEKIIPEISKLV